MINLENHDKFEDIVLLLKLVEKQGDIKNLVNKSFSYSQILNLIHELMDLQLLYLKEDSNLSLTELGYNKMRVLNKKLGRNKIETFIAPQSEYKIPIDEKLDIYDIFLPKSTKNLK